MARICRGFFINDTATTEIYTLSLHDALPISDEAVETYAQLDELARMAKADGDDRPIGQLRAEFCSLLLRRPGGHGQPGVAAHLTDRKSTRLNSSHANISYAVFCLKKNKSLTPFLCLWQFPFRSANFPRQREEVGEDGLWLHLLHHDPLHRVALAPVYFAVRQMPPG